MEIIQYSVGKVWLNKCSVLNLLMIFSVYVNALKCIKRDIFLFYLILVIIIIVSYF